MPDLHDLDHFDHFNEGLPRVDTLPASEIRRRGDRLRRRRTALATAGGVLAAAVAIGTPVLALSGGDGSSRGTDPSYATQPTTTAPRTEPADGWTTAIPEGFPLLDGFADPAAVPNDALAQDPNPALACGGDGFTGFTDNAVVTYQGPSEDREVRILAVYRDAAAAEAQVEALRTATADCGPFPVKGAERTWTQVPVDLGAEESLGFAEQVRHDDGLVSDLTLFVVGRTGNAVYLDSSHGAVGGDEQVAREVARLTQKSTAPVDALCVFSVDGC